MNLEDHRFWQAATATEEPTAAELALAEAQLAELPPMAQLSDAEIATLMDRVVAPAIRAKRLHPLRRYLLAACSIMVVALAWELWPERAKAMVTLDYPRAVALTTLDSYSDAERLSAFGLILERCGFAEQLLTDLEKDSILVVAQEASNARIRLIRLLSTGSERGPMQVDETLELAASVARDAQLPASTRLLALGRVEQLIEEGLRAMLHRPMQTAAAESTRVLWCKGLLAQMKHQ